MSADELKAVVSVGDTVVYIRRSEQLLGDRITTNAADDRACCAVILRTLELLKKDKLNIDLIVSFSSQEESGGSGAATMAFEYNPDKAIILDVSFAQTPDTSYPEAGELGGGPMIGIAPVLSREIFGKLKEAAIRTGEKWQVEVMPRDTGTNADDILTAGSGVPSGMLSLPLRYMHTYSEVIDKKDIESTAKVLAEYIKVESELYA